MSFKLQLHLSFVFLLSVIFMACSEKTFEPVKIAYEVKSDNENAVALVHEYYGATIEYDLYGPNQIEIIRKSGVGETHEWWTGDSLLVREQNDPYCNCVAIHDQWLTEFLKNPMISAPQPTGKKEKILGYRCKEYLGVTPDGDSTWMMITDELPNGWYVIPSLSGMPLRYTYRLMGSLISYEAVESTPLTTWMSYEGWRRNCVEQPAEAFVDFEEDSVVVNVDGLVISGLVVDAANSEPMLATIQVEEVNGDDISQGQMLLAEGNIDLFLRPGSMYKILFKAQGYAPKQLEIDLSPMPNGSGLFSLDLDMTLFETNNVEVIQFLERTPIGKAVYDKSEDTVIFDLAYTQNVKLKLGELMEKDL